MFNNSISQQRVEDDFKTGVKILFYVIYYCIILLNITSALKSFIPGSLGI